MRKNTKIGVRLLSLLLTVALTVGMLLAALPLTAGAATTTKAQKSYEIAVVFDNSGSMYEGKAWCRAKYAMEIFASMLSYENGDKLRIYPMWEITTDGSFPGIGEGGSYQPITINSKADIDKIANMFTVNPSATPFAPVTEAFDYLKTSSATERWLLVLTDGAFNQTERNKYAGFSETVLRERLLAMATGGIKVQYLGFDQANELKEDRAKGFFTKKASDTSLKDDLINICNAIFQRSVLPTNRLSGTSLNLDLSMKNVIVFAQGPNAKIASLVDESGKEMRIALDSGQRKYSTIAANQYTNAPVDTTLAGQVVTFADCPKGKYTLNYTGAEAVQIFYEPDVDIKVTLTDSDGQVVDGSSGKIVTGEYTINSMIVDGKTGEDVTNHELMGNDVDITIKTKTSKDSSYTEHKNGAKLMLEPDSATDIIVTGTYLKEYTITSEGNPDLDWLRGLTVEIPTVDFKVNATVQQSQSWYKISDYENWQPVRVDMTLDGQPLTEEQMARVVLTVTPDPQMKYRVEPIPGESAYNVYIASDEAGAYVETETGAYDLTASATYTDEYEKIANSNAAEVSFDIQTYSKIWIYLFWILLLAILFALWLMYMLRKVLPKEIRKDSASFTTISSGELDGSFVDVEYRRKGKSLSIAGSSAVDYNEQCSATFELRAVDNHFTKSKRRRVSIIGIDSVCEEMKIGGTAYVNYEGQWVKKTMVKSAEAGKPIPPLDQQISCSPRFELSREGGLSTLTCKTKTTK